MAKTYAQNQDEHHRIRTFREEYLVFLKQFCVDYDGNIFSMKYKYDIEPLRGSCFGVIPLLPGSRLRRQPGAIDIEPLRGSSITKYRHFYSCIFLMPCVHAAFLGV